MHRHIRRVHPDELVAEDEVEMGDNLHDQPSTSAQANPIRSENVQDSPEESLQCQGKVQILLVMCLGRITP